MRAWTGVMLICINSHIERVCELVIAILTLRIGTRYCLSFVFQFETRTVSH